MATKRPDTKPLTAKGEKMKFNEMYPSRFLKADDLVQPLTVKIKEVVMEKLGGENGDEKPVCYFTGQSKALALNKTNCEAIINIANSDDTDDWPGTKVELYKTTVMFHGQRTACVRIRKLEGARSHATAVHATAAFPEPDDNVPDSGDEDVK